MAQRKLVGRLEGYLWSQFITGFKNVFLSLRSERKNETKSILSHLEIPGALKWSEDICELF